MILWLCLQPGVWWICVSISYVGWRQACGPGEPGAVGEGASWGRFLYAIWGYSGTGCRHETPALHEVRWNDDLCFNGHWGYPAYVTFSILCCWIILWHKYCNCSIARLHLLGTLSARHCNNSVATQGSSLFCGMYVFLQVHSSRSFLLFPSWGWALPTGQWQGGVVWIPPEYTTITVEDDAQHWWWDRALHTVGPTQAFTTTTVSCCMRSAGWVLISILDLAELRLAFHLPWIYYINNTVHEPLTCTSRTWPLRVARESAVSRMQVIHE